MRFSKQVLQCLLSALVLGTAACGGGGGDSPPPPPTGDVLDRLGADRSGETVRADAQTNHPLRKKFSVYKKRSEIYLSGVNRYNSDGYFTDPAEGKHTFLLDDQLGHSPAAPKGYAPLFVPDSDQTWTQYPVTSTAADLSGTGREWVVSLYHNRTAKTAFLRVVRPDTTAGTYVEQEFTLGEFDFPAWAVSKLYIAAGDLDGDGSDELATVIGNQVVIWKYQGNKFVRLDSRPMRGNAPNVPEQVTTVAIGDVDNDGVPEVVVCDGVTHILNSATYHVFSLDRGLLKLKKGGEGFPIMEKTDQPGRAGLTMGRVAIGDLDGDGGNELIFSGDAENNQLVTVVMRYNSTTGQFDTVDSTRSNYGGANWGHQYVPVVAVFKPDGTETRRNALLVYRQIFWLDPKDGKDGKLAERWAGLRLGVPTSDKVVVGDFTGDGKDDVAFLSPDNQTSLQVWSYQSGSFHQVDYIDFDPATRDATATNLCAVNIDDDSTVVEYTGEYELLWSQPQVVAVLAAPPYYLGADLSQAETAFGWKHEDAYSESETLGITAGFSVGFSTETPFWGIAASSEVKLSFDTSRDFSFSSTNSLTSAVSLPSQNGENYVIFSYTPLDVYYYKVVSSPKAGQIDKRMSIQLPRSTRVTSLELGKYNAVVDAQYRVPADLQSQLTQALGDPTKYPTYSNMVALVGNPPTQGFRTPVAPKYQVSPGGGPVSFELETSHDTAYGEEFGLSIGLEAQTVTGGVLVGGRTGFHYGYKQETRVGDGTVITGKVPAIQSSSGQNGFVVGLFAYPRKRADGGSFVVVNYWVEP